jgi:hypothetical protein
MSVSVLPGANSAERIDSSHSKHMLQIKGVSEVGEGRDSSQSTL